MEKNKLIDPAWEKDEYEEAEEDDEYEEAEGDDTYFELAGEDYRLFEEWNEIIESSKSNITLQRAIEQVKIVHALSKDYGP